MRQCFIPYFKQVGRNQQFFEGMMTRSCIHLSDIIGQLHMHQFPCMCKASPPVRTANLHCNVTKQLYQWALLKAQQLELLTKFI